MAKQNLKWVSNNVGSCFDLTIDNNNFYRIYECQSGNFKIVKRSGKCVTNWEQEYKDFKSAKRAVDRYLKSEPILNVTNQTGRNTTEWIEGVPKPSESEQCFACVIYSPKYGQKVARIYGDGRYQVAGSSHEFSLKDDEVTHYIPLDNISDPSVRSVS